MRISDLAVVNAYHAFGLPSLARWNRDRLPLCRIAELRPDITGDISWVVTARRGITLLINCVVTSYHAKLSRLSIKDNFLSYYNVYFSFHVPT